MLSAEYGGTGGRAIEAGMVVEEPDIEIGAGVSSKGEFLIFFLCSGVSPSKVPLLISLPQR